ncbi:MAG TPA: hypothetical protein VEC17_03760, partial [Candidatus Binatia bacterium]|nr:hypothetical protein [Candidatus Binatia bacterium]
MALIYQDLSEPVKKVVEQTLSQRVVSCEELRDGKTHFVYIVVTDGGRYIVKAFRQRTIFSEYDLPDHDKLLWVTDQLDKEGIRHQKILAFQPKHELLPGGFVIFE